MCVLPKDITMEILSKLPAKSLCRFKCVSKKWQYLISHHRFMKMHLSRARTRLLGDGMIDLFDVDLDTISANDDKISLLSLEFPGQCNCEGYFYGGSCNGLLCIFSACLKLYLYNPSINKCKFIRKYRNRKFLHGFGYAESIENYKIVRVLYPGNVVKVYSVKDRSWSTIQSDLRIPEEYFNWNEFDIMEYSNAGVYLNGAVHWAFENHEGLCVIAAFDLVEDKFKILPPPGNVHMGKRGAWCGYTLGVLRGRLCLVKERRGHDNQIWVMEEYGVQRSWTRILILRKFARLKPLCLLNNSETMLSAHLEGLAFYDLKDRVLKKADIGVIADGDYCEMTFGDENNNSDLHVYTESLVPPTYKPDENTEDPMYEYWFK